MTNPPVQHSMAQGTTLPPTTLEDGSTVRWPKGNAGYALIAESDQVFAERLRGLVAQQRLEPVVATDALAALAVLRSRGAPKLAIINVALADERKAGPDAFSLLCAIRELAPASATPLLVIAERLAHRKRAVDLKAPLSIGAIASPHLSLSSIDAMIDKLLEVDWVPPSTEVLELLLGTVRRRFGVTTAILELVIGDETLLLHTGPSGDVIAHSRLFAPTGREPLVVGNTFEHATYARHPLVKSGVVGSGVSVPVVSTRGRVVGSLTVVDAGAWLGAPALVDALRVEADGIASMLTIRAPAPALPEPAPTPGLPGGTVFARILPWRRRS